jgi:hypothetical protein
VTPPPAPRRRWRDGIATAAVVTLASPASWVTGLAGFLAGGGLVLVTWPILVLPTMTGIQSALGGPVSSLAFGNPSPALVALIAGLVVAGVAVLLAGTWIGAWAERAGIEAALQAARDEGLTSDGERDPANGHGTAGDAVLDGAPGTSRVALLRLLSLAPVVVALGLAWPLVYGAAYRELIVPGDLSVPVEIRVLSDIPWVLAGVVAVWLIADAAAALGVRHLVLGRRPVLPALLRGWSDLARRPHRVIATAVVGFGLPAIPAILAIAGAALGWDVARTALIGDRPLVEVVVPVVLWVATWLGALVIVGAGAAFRSAAFTFEARHRIAPGTV